MKILIIQQKMIGDVLISSILCNNLKKAYPNSQVDYLVYESTAAVLQGNPNIDNIILFKEKHRSSSIEFLKIAYKIRKEKYDLVIDAYSKLESWLIVLLSNAKRRISYRKPGRNFLYTDKLPFTSYPKTNLGLAIERRLSLLKPLNLEIEIEAKPILYVSEEEKQNAKLLFEKHHVQANRPTIMISILGSEVSKTYPLKYMAFLVNEIAIRYNVNILFNYFPEQIEDAKRIYEECSKAAQDKIYFDLLGDNLRSFIAIMDKCDIIIGNDGGAINIGKTLGKPSFVIFSPWIEKKVWSIFEDGIHHVSVHLKEYKPELFEKRSEKYIKQNAEVFYNQFETNLFINSVFKFIDINITLKGRFIEFLIKPVQLSLSALIITYNEEKHIKEVLQDISFAEEIIVVDSYSSDQTLSIVANFPKARIIQNKFVDYSSQRNIAIDSATNKWILFIDADERFTHELKEEVIETIQKPDAHSAYLFYRTFMFKDQRLRFSGWQTDKIFRLFQKGKANYITERLVHEKLQVRGEIGKLKHKLIHYSYTDYDSYKSKMISYGRLKAKEEFAKSITPNVFFYILHPLYKFLYQYIVRLGFLDGRKGVIICYLNAISVSERYRELRKLKNRKKLLPKS